MSNTYSECVFVALLIQRAKRMRRVILSYVDCLGLQYFSALSHKRHDLGGGGITEQKLCVLCFSTISSETSLVLKRN